MYIGIRESQVTYLINHALAVAGLENREALVFFGGKSGPVPPPDLISANLFQKMLPSTMDLGPIANLAHRISSSSTLEEHCLDIIAMSLEWVPMTYTNPALILWIIHRRSCYRIANYRTSTVSSGSLCMMLKPLLLILPKQASLLRRLTRQPVQSFLIVDWVHTSRID